MLDPPTLGGRAAGQARLLKEDLGPMLVRNATETSSSVLIAAKPVKGNLQAVTPMTDRPKPLDRGPVFYGFFMIRSGRSPVKNRPSATLSSSLSFSSFLFGNLIIFYFSISSHKHRYRARFRNGSIRVDETTHCGRDL